jgi:hypothetical protein
MIDHLGVLKFNNVITHIPEDTLMKWKVEKKAKAREEAKAAEEAKGGEEGEGNEPVEEDDSTTLETLILQVIKLSQDIQVDPETYIYLLRLIRKVLPDNKIISQK